MTQMMLIMINVFIVSLLFGQLEIIMCCSKHTDGVGYSSSTHSCIHYAVGHYVAGQLLLQQPTFGI